jgi:hypothetical protein
VSYRILVRRQAKADLRLILILAEDAEGDARSVRLVLGNQAASNGPK